MDSSKLAFGHGDTADDHPEPECKCFEDQSFDGTSKGFKDMRRRVESRDCTCEQDAADAHDDRGDAAFHAMQDDRAEVA